MGSMFGGGGGGGSAPAPAPQYVAPPAPGTLVQTIVSGNPNPNGALPPAPVGETEEERRLRIQRQNNILGGGSDGASAAGSNGTASGNSAAAGNAAAGNGADDGSSGDGL